MIDSSPDPSAFVLSGGPVGVLLIHGFTGSPAEMRLVADNLNARGYTVSVPLLPGHGTTPAELDRQRAAMWSPHVRAALDDLRKACRVIFVGGLSLGSLLALQLAGKERDVAGAILYSPPILVTDARRHLVPLVKWAVRELPKPADEFADPKARQRLWNYSVYPLAAAHEVMRLTGQVTRLLPDVRCPTLVIVSARDRVIHSKSAEYILERLGSPDKRLVRLQNSGHVITLDSEWEQVADDTTRFMREHESESDGASPSGPEAEDER